MPNAECNMLSFQHSTTAVTPQPDLQCSSWREPTERMKNASPTECRQLSMVYVAAIRQVDRVIIGQNGGSVASGLCSIILVTSEARFTGHYIRSP